MILWVFLIKQKIGHLCLSGAKAQEFGLMEKDITGFNYSSNLFCELALVDHKLNGYLYIIQGKINSVSIFLGNDVVDLYSSEILSEDNRKTLNDLSEYLGVNVENTNSIEYKINHCFDDVFVPQGEFHFSLLPGS